VHNAPKNVLKREEFGAGLKRGVAIKTRRKKLVTKSFSKCSKIMKKQAKMAEIVPKTSLKLSKIRQQSSKITHYCNDDL